MNTNEITALLYLVSIGVAGVIALFILEGLLKFISNTLGAIFTSLTSTGAISLYKGLLSLVIILT